MNHVFRHLSRPVGFLLCRMLMISALAALAAPAFATPQFTTLHSFSALSTGGANYDGANSYAALVQGSDGNFYGTTADGGASGYGTVFKITSGGTVTTLVSFNSSNGANPYAALVQGSDGNFYGTTANGGASGTGTVFKITPAGTLTTLYAFSVNSSGAHPYAALVQGADGNFYGTTSEGGTHSRGIVFKITPSGGTPTILVNFHGTDGDSPATTMVLGKDGNLYGTTLYGGSTATGDLYSGDGTVFKIATNGTLSGTTLTTLVNFNGNNGDLPSGLIQGTDGNFYGTSSYGGSQWNNGEVFKVVTNGTLAGTALTVLTSFEDVDVDGVYPEAGLAQGADGDFYGTTSLGGGNDYGTVFKITPTGTLTTLINFNNTDGSNANARMILGTDGNFYGTTSGGGANNTGTVYEIAAESQVIRQFTAYDAVYHYGGLVQGSDLNFYGTSVYGGATNNGTLYKAALSATPASATLTNLVNLNGSTGAEPYDTLIVGPDGNYYGTAYVGGSSRNGTIFKVTSGGAVTVLHNFSAEATGGINSDGANPIGSLLLGHDGNFYGTSAGGGAYGHGTIFEVNGTTLAFTTLASFNGTNGDVPYAGLVQGPDDSFYGTTYNGGSSGNGTLYKLSGTALTTLVNFTGANGANPIGALTFGNDGGLYGTTYKGGSSGYGTIFEVILPSGSLTTLINLTGTNGENPWAGLILGTDGSFYGVTGFGGVYGQGTAFKLTFTYTYVHSHLIGAWALSTLMNFSGQDGTTPFATLCPAIDGNFYGTTISGGLANNGTIYQIFGPPFCYGASISATANSTTTITLPYTDPTGMGIDRVGFPSSSAHGTVTVVPGSITELGTLGIAKI